MLEPAYSKNSQTQSPDKPNGQSADNDTGIKSAAEPPRFIAPSHGGVDILKLLTELEDMVENTPKKLGMMFRFDEDRFHMTIMKIRANLPEEMKRASKLARDSERIVEESREHAGSILEDAKKSAQTEMERIKAENTRIRQEAQTDAKKIREAADQEARLIQEEARLAGEKLVSEARMQAAHLIEDSEIIRQAQAAAYDLQVRADEEAFAVRRGADDYARDVLANLEAVLGKAVGQVQRGREMLEHGR